LAAEWYRKAADHGNPDAQNSLATLYSSGRGVKQDAPVAVRWFRRAADQGNVMAQMNLALRYARGEGIGQDNSEAYYWFSCAAAQGSPDAKQHIETAKRVMSTAEIAVGRALFNSRSATSAR
jgi:TPR repeat protein